MFILQDPGLLEEGCIQGRQLLGISGLASVRSEAAPRLDKQCTEQVRAEGIQAEHQHHLAGAHFSGGKIEVQRT